MLHVFPVTLQETPATLQETRATLHASASAEYTKPFCFALCTAVRCTVYCSGRFVKIRVEVNYTCMLGQ